MLKILSRSLDPETAASKLFSEKISAESIWADVCQLPKYSVSPALACCETAFARVAVMKLVIRHTQSGPVEARMRRTIDMLVAQAFQMGDEETNGFYHATLSDAAIRVIAHYDRHAHHPSLIAAELLNRIGAVRGKALGCATLFTRFGNDVEARLRTFRIES